MLGLSDHRKGWLSLQVREESVEEFYREMDEETLAIIQARDDGMLDYSGIWWASGVWDFILPYL